MTSTQRRLQGEWDRLERLAEMNPRRLCELSAKDHVFHFQLHNAPVALAAPRHDEVVATHAVRVMYPSYFPSAPMELYVGDAFLHPNVHPITGFVCLWEKHDASHTIEHAVHKLVAMMDGRLWNNDSLHRMQPDALEHGPQMTSVAPLRGLVHDDAALFFQNHSPERRSRLS